MGSDDLMQPRQSLYFAYDRTDIWYRYVGYRAIKRYVITLLLLRGHSEISILGQQVLGVVKVELPDVASPVP